MLPFIKFIVAFLTVSLSGWNQTETKCEKMAVQAGPPGVETEECFASFKPSDRNDQALYVFVWSPVVARDGGPMKSEQDYQGTLLGKPVTINRTSLFMGVKQEVLTASVDVDKPQGHVMVYAKNLDVEAFQRLLDGMTVTEAGTAPQ